MKKKCLAWVSSFVCAIAAFFALTLAGCTAKVYSITLDKTDVTMTVGEVMTLVAAPSEEDAEVVWSSSDADTVTVYKGNLRAVKAGNAVIMAGFTAEGKDYTAACKVKVVDYYVATLADKVVYADESLDVSLDSRGIEDFRYTISVVKGDSEVSGIINDDVFCAEESGVYKLTYVVTGKDIVETTLTCNVTVKAPGKYGELNDFSSLNGVSVWSSNSTQYAIADKLPDSAPESVTSGLKIVGDMNIRFTMTDVNLVDYVKDSNSNDFFEFDYYIEAATESKVYLIDGYVDIMRSATDSYNTDIVKRFSVIKLTVNQWAKLRVYVREFESYASENPELYIRPHLGLVTQAAADAIANVYVGGFRFVAADIATNAEEAVSVKLPAAGITDLTYTYKVMQDESEKASGSEENTEINALPAGEYSVVYTINSKQIADKTITRKLTVKGAGEYVLSGDEIYAYHQNNTLPQSIVATSEKLPEGAPEGATAIKISGATSGFSCANDSNLRVKFKNINLIGLANNEDYADKYLVFYVYFEHLSGESYPSDWDDFLMMDGSDSVSMTNVEVDDTNKIYESKQVGNKYGLLKGMITPGAWTQIKIPMRYIRVEVENALTRTGYNAIKVLNPCLGVNHHTASGNGAAQPFNFYIYSAGVFGDEAYEPEMYTDVDKYIGEQFDISYAPSGLYEVSYSVSAKKGADVDVTESVIAQNGNSYIFCASESGEYTVTYTVKALGYQSFTVSRNINVLNLKTYSKEFDDLEIYKNESRNISIEEPDIPGFGYTVKVTRDGEEIDGWVSDDVFTPPESGVYTVTYTITAPNYANTEVVRRIFVKEPVVYGAITDFSNQSGVTIWGSTDYAASIVEELPGGREGTALKVDYVNNVRLMMADVNLVTYALDASDNDYFELTYYIQGTGTGVYLYDGYVDVMPVNNDGGNTLTKRYSNIKLTVNSWTTVKLYVREYREFIDEKSALYVRFHFATPANIAAFYFDEFKFVAADIVANENEKISVTLPSATLSSLTYNYKVMQGETEKASGTETRTTTDALPLGEYSVVYTITTKQVTNQTITRKLTVKGADQYVLSADEIYAYHQNNTLPQSIVATSEKLPEGAPEGATAIKISGATSGFSCANDSNLRVKFKNINLIDIAKNENYADKYLVFYVYFEHLSGTSYTTAWDDFLVMDGSDSCILFNGYSGDTDKMYDDTDGGNNYSFPKGMIDPGKWCQVKIPVEYIAKKVAYAETNKTGSNTACTINPVIGVNNHTASGSGAAQPFNFYIYSAGISE